MQKTSECHEANICTLKVVGINCACTSVALKVLNIWRTRISSKIQGKTKIGKERADQAFKIQISVLTQNFEKTVEQCRAFSSYASKQERLPLINSGVQHLQYKRNQIDSLQWLPLNDRGVKMLWCRHHNYSDEHCCGNLHVSSNGFYTWIWLCIQHKQKCRWTFQ